MPARPPSGVAVAADASRAEVEAEAASVDLPGTQAWAEDIESMIADRTHVPLPETHPGTRRAGFAETHEIAAIVAGLVAAAEAAPDSAMRKRWLAVASRIVGFYRGASSDGERPVLSAYRTSSGARLAFSEEFGLPAIATPAARANVAMARAALEWRAQAATPRSGNSPAT